VWYQLIVNNVYLQANQKEEEERVAEIKVLPMHSMIYESFHLKSIDYKFKLECFILQKEMEFQLQQFVLFSILDVSSTLLIL
jgi:hypothetical protein